MRVVGGTFRGRALATPSDEAIRPTSDRVREAVFNILAHGTAAVDLEGKRVIDLFAGTGALGIEAISRGAAYCLFVETGVEARGLIRTNVEALALGGVTRMFRRDATDLGPIGTMAPYDVVFLDPPYGKGLGEAALVSLATGGWLVAGATVVLEERAGVVVVLPAGFEPVDERTWGDTTVRFLRRE